MKKFSYSIFSCVDFFQDTYDTDILSIESAAQGLDIMKKEFIFYKRTYEDQSQSPMWKYMLEYFVDRYTQMAEEKFNTNSLDAQIQYSIRLYCYGCVGMTQEWLLKDTMTPSKTIAEMMFQSMPQNLKTIYF